MPQKPEEDFIPNTTGLLVKVIFSVAVPALFALTGLLFAFVIGRLDRIESSFNTHAALPSHPGTLMQFNAIQREIELSRAQNATEHGELKSAIHEITQKR